MQVWSTWVYSFRMGLGLLSYYLGTAMRRRFPELGLRYLTRKICTERLIIRKALLQSA